MNSKWKYVITLLIGFSAMACRKPKELEYRNVQNFKLKHTGVKEAVITADVSMYNPNGFSLKLKDADVALFLNERQVGNVTIDNSSIVPSRDSFSLPVTLALNMANVLPDALQL